MYYVYVYLNEKPIRDLPLIFNIGKSSRQDELQEKAEVLFFYCMKRTKFAIGKMEERSRT